MASEAQAPWLVRFWWVFPAIVITSSLVLGAFHRERPLTLDDTEPQVRQALDATTHAAGQRDWHSLELRSERSFTPSYGSMVRSEVRTRWERLSGYVYRRADDWFDMGGSKPLYQERTVSWLGLFGLRWVAREPAPIFHDIMDDAGWLGDRTLELAVQRIDPEFPLREGSELVARTKRQAEPVPGTATLGPTTREQQVTCRAGTALASVSGLEALKGHWHSVECEAMTRNGDASPSTLTSRRRLAFSTHLGLYLLVQYDEVEPRSPFDAQAAAPRWSSTVVRYRSATIDP